MIIIPRTHGRLTASQEVDPALADREPPTAWEIQAGLTSRLHQIFHEAFGVGVHPDWVGPLERTEDPADGLVTFRLDATAPTVSRVIWDDRLGQVRTLSVAVSTESRIPIVQNPYQSMELLVDPFHRPDRYLVFQGWNSDTGMMAFGKAS